MKNVCVITGGGSGMGLAAAKFMPKEKILVISGRTVAKLENAVNELKALGYEAHQIVKALKSSLNMRLRSAKSRM